MRPILFFCFFAYMGILASPLFAQGMSQEERNMLGVYALMYRYFESHIYHTTKYMNKKPPVIFLDKTPSDQPCYCFSSEAYLDGQVVYYNPKLRLDFDSLESMKYFLHILRAEIDPYYSLPYQIKKSGFQFQNYFRAALLPNSRYENSDLYPFYLVNGIIDDESRPKRYEMPDYELDDAFWVRTCDEAFSMPFAIDGNHYSVMRMYLENIYFHFFLQKEEPWLYRTKISSKHSSWTATFLAMIDSYLSWINWMQEWGCSLSEGRAALGDFSAETWALTLLDKKIKPDSNSVALQFSPDYDPIPDPFEIRCKKEGLNLNSYAYFQALLYWADSSARGEAAYTYTFERDSCYRHFLYLTNADGIWTTAGTKFGSFMKTRADGQYVVDWDALNAAQKDSCVEHCPFGFLLKPHSLLFSHSAGGAFFREGSPLWWPKSPTKVFVPSDVYPLIETSAWTDDIYGAIGGLYASDTTYYTKGPKWKDRREKRLEKNLSIIKYAQLYEGWQNGKKIESIQLWDRKKKQYVQKLDSEILDSLRKSYLVWAKKIRKMECFGTARKRKIRPKGRYRIQVQG